MHEQVGQFLFRADDLASLFREQLMEDLTARGFTCGDGVYVVAVTIVGPTAAQTARDIVDRAKTALLLQRTFGMDPEPGELS